MEGVGGTHIFAVTGLMEGGSCDFTAIKGSRGELELEAGGEPMYLKKREARIHIARNCMNDPVCADIGMWDELSSEGGHG